MRPASGVGEIRALAHSHHHTGPTSVRLSLEEFLGHHSVLAIRMMRALVGGSPDLAQTIKDSLSTNTADLVGVVKSTHGLKAAKKFRSLWTKHNVALIRYAEALAAGDNAAEKDAEEQLDKYRQDFGSFVASATDNKIKAASAAGALKTHISQLMRQAEEYEAGNYAQAYRLERAAFAHMFPTGKALAGGLLAHSPGEFVLHLQDPGQDLRSRLGQLLGEHVELLVDATRAGLSGTREEFEQAAASLNNNTKDLSEAMDALFGKNKTKDFVDIWSDHIDGFIDYTAAVTENNQEEQDAARNNLADFQQRLGSFLINATHNKAGIESVSHDLSSHDDLLLRQINAFDAQQYAAAHDASNRAYKDMFHIASRLGALIEKKSGKAAPKGGAQTGGGGTARLFGGWPRA
jgi:hypothetical protein